MDPKVKQSWEDFLNPEVLRGRLIKASIYIAGFEALKEAIVDHLRHFFLTGTDESGDKFDPRYKSDVLSRNKSPVHASLDWLKEMHAVDDEDIVSFNRVKFCRNVLAHRLLATIGTDGLPADFEKCLNDMVELLHKIEKWWIVEVEIPTNPDFDGREIDEAGIMSLRVMTIRLLCDIALGDDKTSRFYYDGFKKLAEND